jgi:topoisomerase-4 subunit A
VRRAASDQASERLDREAGRVRAGPGFPDRRRHRRTAASILESYATGRGSFRVRARWEKEDTGRGGYVIVITEIPYQVQKSRLIEKIAEL